MYSLNLSVGTKYLTQLNNKVNPMSTCNVTSAIMGLEASGIMKFDHEGFETQPEDVLANLLLDDVAFERMQEHYSWAVRDGYMPYEVHGMLEWGINTFVGRQVDRFTTHGSIFGIVKNLIKGNCSLVSGKFTKGGHIVCVVGFETSLKKNELDAITNGDITALIIDDPYGNHYTQYENRNGNNVKMNYNEFDAITKTYNQPFEKWVHFLGEE